MSMLRFFSKYLAIPAGMMSLAAGIAAYQVNQEAENYAYFSATWAWSHVHEPTRDVIRQVMADGVMTRWESAGVYRAIMDDVHMYMTCPVGLECRDKTVEQARTALQEAMKK